MRLSLPSRAIVVFVFLAEASCLCRPSLLSQTANESFSSDSPPPPLQPQPNWGGLPAKCWIGFGSYGNQHAMCVETQTGHKHFNAASSRTGSEYRCAAGTQIDCFLMKQAFGYISCCMLNHHTGVSSTLHASFWHFETRGRMTCICLFFLYFFLQQSQSGDWTTWIQVKDLKCIFCEQKLLFSSIL